MYNALEDIKLETIDFKWISEATKIPHLKRAIKLIEMDGNYFTDLKEACYERIGQLDPNQKRIKVDNHMVPQMKAEIDKQLEEWEQQVAKAQANAQKNKGRVIQVQEQPLSTDLDPETYFDKQNSNVNKRRQAENEKTKGNEAIKSKDYQEAIKYYSKSIQLDPTLFQSYGNRALAFIRLKQFQKALNDCEEAIKVNPKYTKAYHRKAKALIGIKNRVEAYKTLQEALKLEPDNSEVIAELKELREELNEGELKQLEGESKFKKIVIEEDSDDEEEIVQK